MARRQRGFGTGRRRFAVVVGTWGLMLPVVALPLQGQDAVVEFDGVTRSLGSHVVRTGADGLTVLVTGGPIEIDGFLSEPAWAEADVAGRFVQQTPREGAAASEATHVRILVDGDALYVGATLHDGQRDSIVARLARRDEDVLADWFYVYLDSYDDDRTAFGFGVSAAGVQRDVRISQDDREDVRWDAVWASAAVIDSAGWSVEMRIPLTQLRFNAPRGEATWGINFHRRVARKNERAYWAFVPRGEERFVSLFSDLRGLGALEPPRRVEVIPYSVARLTRSPGDPSNPFYRASDPHGTVGADVRIGLGSSLTLSATLNPDFGQVEADPATVNLTAFETFYEERRPFFVEGSDIFQLAFPFWPPFFYSRRIGRSPQGSAPAGSTYRDHPSASTILGALKLSGKTEGGWSVGVLDAVTGTEEVRFVDGGGARGRTAVEPRTNYAVARVARELRGGESSVGLMATSVHRTLDGTELDFLHDQAFGLAADAFHRLQGGEYVANVSILTSHVRGPKEALLRTQRAAGHYFDRPDAGHVELDPDRTSLSGLSMAARFQKSRGPWKWGVFAEATSPGYEVADLGFNPTLDHIRTNAWLRYESYEPGTLFRSWNLGTMAMTQRTWGGEVEEVTGDLGFHFQLLNYWGGGVWIMRHQPAWSATALRGGPAIRKPGRWMGSFSVNTDSRRSVSGNGYLFWEAEDETEGRRLSASANLVYRPSDRAEVRIGPTVSLSRDGWQYVGEWELAGRPTWMVGDLERRTLSLGTRLDYTLSPTTSLQMYVRPFLASGRYRALREVVAPVARADRERFRTYEGAPDGDGVFRIDRDGDGVADLDVDDPSFNVGSLQLNAVLRWEYRPGSTLFAVWTHDRDSSSPERLDLDRDLDRLLDRPGRNVFMVKASYWVGL